MDAKIKVIRHTFNTKNDRNIIGDLFINDLFFCYTLEDELRADGVKVYGETAISAGKYKVIINKSTRFKRDMPLLLNVPMFEGIRIHGGNHSLDTLGCILVAFSTDLKRIWRTAEKTLTKKLKEFDNIEIEIVNRPFTYVSRYLAEV